MSDFDKEAERERLREKYEAEQEDREATQHMSELLLKGATMTNSHCGNCGDPIFRYDGQEFCPTCNEQANAGAATDASARNGDPATARNQNPAAVQNQDDATARGGDAGTGEAAAATGESETERSTTPAQSQARSADTNVKSRRSARDVDARAAPEPDAGDVTPGTDAVADVEATVERFAAAAARTDDPERAREYLATVRDATDTLRALRGDAR